MAEAVKKTAKKVTTTSAVVKKTVASKTVKKESDLTVDVFDVNGKVTGQLELAKHVFGVAANKAIIAQAVRVYLANQRQGTRSTKTRGEVSASTRKIYRQKGTGRARHGSLKAPLFVHYGGVSHGPRPVDFSMTMPQKMRQKALTSVLSAKLKGQEIKVVSGLATMEAKTKAMAAALSNLKLRNKSNDKLLVVINDGTGNIVRAARNLEGVTLTSAARLNAYDVLTARQILFAQEAVESLQKRLGK